MCQSSSIDVLDAIEELVENETVWHKSCHLQFSNSKLAKAKERSERIRKRKRDDSEVRLSKSRRLSGCQNAKPESCIDVVRRVESNSTRYQLLPQMK